MDRKLSLLCRLLFFIPLILVSGSCHRSPVSTDNAQYWTDKIASLENQIAQLHSKYIELAKQSEEAAMRSYNAGSVAEGRLTTESGVAVSTTDRSAQSTLYYTPFHGSRISLYSGSIWKIFEFSEISLALSGLTNNTNYDVFVYDNSGTLTLELTAWSSDTARATALTQVDGVLLRSGSVSRRYLGTVRATSTSTIEDSRAKRFVWNSDNRVTRILYVTDSTNSWSYGTASWRSVNGSTANRVEFVAGEAANPVFIRSLLLALSSSSTSNFISSGVGIDSTTTNSSQMRGSGTVDSTVKQVWGFYVGNPGLGYHYAQWLENSNSTSITLYGDNADDTKYRSGLVGEFRG